MTKDIKDMTGIERVVFDMYCDLEYALVLEYEHGKPENISKQLMDAVYRWSVTTHTMGLIDDDMYNQAQKMAKGDNSWVNS